MNTFNRYFRGSFFITVFGLAAGAYVGWQASSTMAGALSAMFICAVLSVLEVSLSFDNAVVNAKVLRKMNDVWRHRFLTWGILVAVFGMRLVFPLIIVGVVAHLDPWAALKLAATQPDEYARIMQAAHVPVAAFGGAFLLMVALRYFFDVNKDIHWIRIIERPLIRLGRLQSAELMVALLSLYAISRVLSPEDALTFLASGIFGLITFILVDGVSLVLQEPEAGGTTATGPAALHKASAAMFVYLEVLDASFSFDGVVGAFAITNNLFIIMIGLGIGAMFVRSLTILLVDRGTLTEYLYLEHGAFYAIASLAVIMFLNTFLHIPEVITGLIGAAFIGLSIFSSIRYKKLNPNAGPVVHQ